MCFVSEESICFSLVVRLRVEIDRRIQRFFRSRETDANPESEASNTLVHKL